MNNINFEIGKEYIFKVTDKGIIPVEEFDSEKYVNKDTDDLEFLTDEEKSLIVREIVNQIKTDVMRTRSSEAIPSDLKIGAWHDDRVLIRRDILAILDRIRLEYK